MLLEKYLPVYHFREKHAININASPDRIHSVARDLDFSESWIIKILFFFRGMPGGTLNLQSLAKGKFVLLEEKQNEELIIGLIGQFWKVNGNLQSFTPDAFIAFDGSYCKAVWNFEVQRAGNKSLLSTETRIFCPEEAIRKKFGFYWRIIGPFSGLIRMEMLRAIKKNAEKAG